jgi:hypothetical protein
VEASGDEAAFRRDMDIEDAGIVLARVITAPACVLYGLLSLEKRTSRWRRKIERLPSALSGTRFLAKRAVRSSRSAIIGSSTSAS